MLDWMLQQDDYIGQASLLTLCSPGGPPMGAPNEVNPAPNTFPGVTAASNVDGVATMFGLSNTKLPPPPTIIGDTLMPLPVITDGAGDMPQAGPVVAIPGTDLTVSTAVTVTSAGCFNPEACPAIRSSRTSTANSASADFVSPTVKPGRPATTVAVSNSGDTTGTAVRALPLPFTIGDHVFTPHPVGFSIDGTTISAGGRGVTIAGTVVQLESSGILKVGTNMISMSNTANLDDHLQLTAYSVGGQVFTPNWIAFPITSTIISAGGPGVTMAGTPIRLEASGILKIGTSMVSIANIASTTVHTRLTTHAVDTALITPNPTTSAVTGTTFSAGGAGTTNPGTPIILGTSGDGEPGGSTLTSTPKHPLQTSSSPSEGHNNPIVRKRLRILFVMYLIYRIIVFL